MFDYKIPLILTVLTASVDCKIELCIYYLAYIFCIIEIDLASELASAFIDFLSNTIKIPHGCRVPRAHCEKLEKNEEAIRAPGTDFKVVGFTVWKSCLTNIV